MDPQDLRPGLGLKCSVGPVDALDVHKITHVEAEDLRMMASPSERGLAKGVTVLGDFYVVTRDDAGLLDQLGPL